MGIKSSVSPLNSSSGRITSFSLGVAGVSSFFAFWGFGFAGASAFTSSFTVSFDSVAGCSSVLAVTFLLPGLRPLFLGVFSSALASATASVGDVTAAGAASFTVSAVAAAGCGVLASSFCALSLVAVYTLSPSFLTLIRDLLRG